MVKTMFVGSEKIHEQIDAPFGNGQIFRGIGYVKDIEGNPPELDFFLVHGKHFGEFVCHDADGTFRYAFHTEIEKKIGVDVSFHDDLVFKVHG
jgi:hypothetical protein